MKKVGFKFSDDNREALLTLLKEYDPGKVKSFIENTEKEVGMFKSLEREITERDRRERVNHILKHLSVTVEDIESNFVSLDELEHLPLMGDDILYGVAVDCVNTVREPLRELMAVLKEYLLIGQKKGRDTPWEFFLATNIAELYGKFIDIPRPYAGNFRGVIEIILGNDRLHSRAINGALKAFNFKRRGKSIKRN